MGCTVASCSFNRLAPPLAMASTKGLTGCRARYALEGEDSLGHGAHFFYDLASVVRRLARIAFFLADLADVFVVLPSRWRTAKALSVISATVYCQLSSCAEGAMYRRAECRDVVRAES